ncbi:MAG: insulinase family protein [bacterium]|nr:insulinase family protein [bacterium]
MKRTARKLLRATSLSLLAPLALSGCASLPPALGGAPPPAWELPPPPPAEGPIVEAGALHRATLENGLTILILEDHHLPRVALGLELRRGAGSVPPGKAGVAAITSEVLQRGAGDRDVLELAKVVEDAGASLSVDAGWDTTGISLAGLAETRELLMEILGDVALRPRFDEGEFAKAVAEHRAGLVSAQDDPATLIRWNAIRALYEDHRYGVPRAGTEETIAALTLDDVMAYWTDRLVPSNAIFWAVGDIDAEVLVAEVEALFGGLESGPVPPKTPPTPERAPEARRIVVVDKPELGQARIIVAHEGIARTEPERIPLDLMNDALGGSGFSSRLMKKIRSDEGLTYGIGSGFSLRAVPGPFSISTFTRKDQVRRVVDLVLAEMSAIRETRPVSPEELAKFVSYNVGRFGLSLETSQSVLSSLVDLEVHGLPDDSLDTYRGRLRAVDLETVHAVTRKRLAPDRAAIVVLGPAAEIVPQLESLGEVEVW